MSENRLMKILKWAAILIGFILIPEIENKLLCNKKIPNLCNRICARNRYQPRFARCCQIRCPMVSEERCKSSFPPAPHGTKMACSKFTGSPVCYTPDNATTFAVIVGRCDLCGLIIGQDHSRVREVHPSYCVLHNVSFALTIQ